MTVLPDHANLKIHVLDERFYISPTDPEKFYPGATTILDVWPKPELIRWYKDVGHNAELISNIAKRKGSAVHDGIQQFLLGNLVMVDYEDGGYEIDEWAGICRFMQFFYRYKPKTIAVEKVLSSEKYEFGGTLDFVCEIDGETWLIDHKFGNQIYDEYTFQLAAYKALLAEYGQEVDRVGILWLKSKHRSIKDYQGIGWQLKEFKLDELKNGWKMFRTAQTIWKEKNPNYKPANKVYPMSFKLDEEPDMELLYENS